MSGQEEFAGRWTQSIIHFTLFGQKRECFVIAVVWIKWPGDGWPGGGWPGGGWPGGIIPEVLKLFVKKSCFNLLVLINEAAERSKECPSPMKLFL